jgi:hypothetical protein
MTRIHGMLRFGGGNRVTQGGSRRAELMGWVAWCVIASASSVGAQEATLPSAGAPDKDAPDAEVLITRLDAKDFGQRNEATRQLAGRGPAVIPLLVSALGNESREVRFRAEGILAQNFLFDDLVPPLLASVDQPHGTAARILLRDRALLQINQTGELESAERLFAFWGTNIEEQRKGILFNLMDAPGAKGVAEVVTPLVGLRRKSLEFEDYLTRLNALSLYYDHRHGAGYLVAKMLADGLRAGDDTKVQFAKRYVEAFELLRSEMQSRGAERSAVRLEVSSRANMSDGATIYVARWIGNDPPPRSAASERLRVTNETLVDELFRGLAMADSRECYRCVGKIHIVDMFDEALKNWPEAPRDGVVQGLTDGVAAAVATGDKPKALVYLDAFEACRDLSQCGLDVASGPGERLARRLHLAALAAPNTREYHPVRSTHARIVRLHELGIEDGAAAFPGEYVERYVAGDTKPLGEEERNALAQYVATLELWAQQKVARDEPGAAACLTLLRGWLLTEPKRVTIATRELTRLVKPPDGSSSGQAVTAELDARLAEWTQQQGVPPKNEAQRQDR